MCLCSGDQYSKARWCLSPASNSSKSSVLWDCWPHNDARGEMNLSSSRIKLAMPGHKSQGQAPLLHSGSRAICPLPPLCHSGIGRIHLFGTEVVHHHAVGVSCKCATGRKVIQDKIRLSSSTENRHLSWEGSSVAHPDPRMLLGSLGSWSHDKGTRVKQFEGVGYLLLHQQYGSIWIVSIQGQQVKSHKVKDLHSNLKERRLAGGLEVRSDRGQCQRTLGTLVVRDVVQKLCIAQL